MTDARVRVSYGETVRTGEYESARLDLAVEKDCEGLMDERRLREIGTVIDDLESHRAKKLPESQIDAVYEHLAEQLKATIKRLPAKHRRLFQ
jgi:hypothetical protein